MIHSQVSASIPQHFSTPCGKLCRRTPEKLAQGTVVSYYTSKCSRFLRFGKYIWYIRLYKMYMTFFQIYARLRRVLAVGINCWQGECRTFYRSYLRSLSSIIIDLPGNAMYILYNVSYVTPSLGSTLILARKNLDVYVHFIQNSKYIQINILWLSGWHHQKTMLI